MDQNKLIKIAVGVGAILLALKVAFELLPFIISLTGSILYLAVMLITLGLIIYGFVKLFKWMLG